MALNVFGEFSAIKQSIRLLFVYLTAFTDSKKNCEGMGRSTFDRWGGERWLVFNKYKVINSNK
jgi:hypothetical protein